MIASCCGILPQKRSYGVSHTETAACCSRRCRPMAGAYFVGSIVERQPTYLLDAATGKEIRRFKWGTVWGLAFSPDGRKGIVGGKSDATLRDLASGNEVRQFRGQSASIAKASISPDGRYMLIAGYGGTAVLRDLTTDKVIHKFGTAYDDLAFLQVVGEFLSIRDLKLFCGTLRQTEDADF